MKTVLTHCGIIPDAGFLGLDDSFESCITATLILFLYSTTISSSGGGDGVDD